jgi:hypothetical protein
VLYRFVHFISANFVLAVFWLYVLAFLLAWSLVFVIPVGPLILLFFGLAGLGIFPILLGLVRLVERTIARVYLRQRICPACRSVDTFTGLADDAIRCSQCSSEFRSSGERLLDEHRDVSAATGNEI